MKITRTAALAAAAVGLTLAAATTAHASTLANPNTLHVTFHGFCRDNTVTFSRDDDTDPNPLEVAVDVKHRMPWAADLVYSGDTGESHHSFHRNGVPKTVQVYVNGKRFAERTYWCGFWAR